MSPTVKDMKINVRRIDNRLYTWCQILANLYNRLITKERNLNFLVTLLSHIISNFFIIKEFTPVETDSSEVLGAATLSKTTIQLAISELNKKIFFVKKCFRPDDLRSKKLHVNNFSRSVLHTQFQALYRDSEYDSKYMQKIMSELCEYLGLEINDLKFFKDKWSSTIISAFGTGYECRYKGMEIAQLTEFHTVNNKIKPMCEIAIGIERILAACLFEGGIKLDTIISYRYFDRLYEKAILTLDNNEVFIDIFREIYAIKKQSSMNDWNRILRLIHVFNIYTSLPNVDNLDRLLILKMIQSISLNSIGMFERNTKFKTKKITKNKTSIHSTSIDPLDLFLSEKILNSSLSIPKDFNEWWEVNRILEEIKPLRNITAKNINSYIEKIYLYLKEYDVNKIFKLASLKFPKIKVLNSMRELFNKIVKKCDKYAIKYNSSSDELGIRNSCIELFKLFKKYFSKSLIDHDNYSHLLKRNYGYIYKIKFPHFMIDKPFDKNNNIYTKIPVLIKRLDGFIKSFKLDTANIVKDKEIENFYIINIFNFINDTAKQMHYISNILDSVENILKNTRLNNKYGIIWCIRTKILLKIWVNIIYK